MILIFGDSFSNNPKGWPGMIGASSFGNNGSSEYRIFNSFCRAFVDSSTKIVFCHTHWSRIFLKDTKVTLSRKLASHRFCDLIFKDVFAKQEQQFISTLESIWDQQFFQSTHELYLQALLAVPNSVHITFFEDIKMPGIHNLYEIWQAHQGKINHMDNQGNQEVAQLVSTWLGEI